MSAEVPPRRLHEQLVGHGQLLAAVGDVDERVHRLSMALLGGLVAGFVSVVARHFVGHGRELRGSSWRRVVVVVGVAIALPSVASTSALAAAPSACSAANASAAATAAGFDSIDFPSGKTPIINVVCGPFFGTGSRGMAGMVPVPTGCGISVGWGVFRYSAGTWRLVMKQDNGAKTLEAVGSRIRETQGYPRPGDPPCNPSRTRSRVWHWNGSKFTSTAWKYSKPQTSAAASGIAFSPKATGGTCLMNDNGTVRGSWVFCWVGARWPPRIHAKLRLNGSFDKRTLIAEPMGIGGRPLPYGHSLTVGRFRCTSAAAGLTCVVIKTGKGLLFNAAGAKRISP